MQNLESVKKTSRFVRLIAFTYMTAFVLALANLVGTNALATEGAVLDSLSTKTYEITKQNKDLEVAINRGSNLSYIEDTAKQMGFVRIKQPLTIQSVDNLASALR